MASSAFTEHYRDYLGGLHLFTPPGRPAQTDSITPTPPVFFNMMYPLCTLNFRFFLRTEGVVLMENRSITAHSSVLWTTPLEKFELLTMRFTTTNRVVHAILAQLPHLPLLLLVVTLGVYNLGGLFPLGFTFSAHLLCTLAYGFGAFFGLNYVALRRYRVAYFQLFLPGGTPLGLLPLLVGLELVSYFSWPLSLIIRLFANLMVGLLRPRSRLSFALRWLCCGLAPLLLGLLGLATQSLADGGEGDGGGGGGFP